MKTIYYTLNENGLKSINEDLKKYVKPEYLDEHYTTEVLKEIVDADRFLDLESGFTLTNNSYEIPKLETISGNPELVYLKEDMFILHEEG